MLSIVFSECSLRVEELLLEILDMERKVFSAKNLKLLRPCSFLGLALCLGQLTMGGGRGWRVGKYAVGPPPTDKNFVHT